MGTGSGDVGRMFSSLGKQVSGCKLPESTVNIHTLSIVGSPTHKYSYLKVWRIFISMATGSYVIQ